MLNMIGQDAGDFFEKLGKTTEQDLDRLTRLDKALLAEFRALAPMEKGPQATDHTKSVYEAAWGKTLKTVQKKIEGKQPFTSIVLGINSSLNLTTGGQNTRVSAKIVRKISEMNNIRSNEAGIPYFRVGVANGRYSIIPNIDPLEMIKHHIPPTVKYVVELGSGRGNNLFMLHLLLGRVTVRKVYYALEYTESGRELAESIAKLDKRMTFSSHAFDYTDPDISMVPDDAPALFFSIHSIEQVAEISPKLYDQLLARKSPTTILHFEPVGWQRYPAIVERRQANDSVYLRALIANRSENVASERCQVINAALHSWRNGYNTNLLQIVEDLKQKDLISAPECVYDFSLHHPCNPTTYLKIVRRCDEADVR